LFIISCDLNGTVFFGELFVVDRVSWWCGNEV